LKKLNISNDIDFSLKEIIGKCIGILGIRGSGKSNTAGVIFEELLNYNYPLTVVDIDGEYFGLKEKYELLVIGKGENVDLNIEPEDAEHVAEISIEQSIPVVLDLSGFLKEDQRETLKSYLTRLWNMAGKLRKPYMIGIEESHEYIPQGKKSELKEIITRVALRGRKRGLGAVVISQRSAKVEKDVLTQAGMLFLHRVVHEADMKVYNDLLPWKKSEVREIVTGLKTGECVFLDESDTKKIYVRERSTFHAGFTPSLDTVDTPQLKQVGESIIEAIEEARKSGQRKKSELDRLKEKVTELEEELEEKEAQVKELEETAKTLGYIQVDLNESSTQPEVQKISKAVIESLEGLEGLEDLWEERKLPPGEPEGTASEETGAQGKTSPVERANDQEEEERTRIDYVRGPGEETGRVKARNTSDSAKKDGGREKNRTNLQREEYLNLPGVVKKRVEKTARKIERLGQLQGKICRFLIERRPRLCSMEEIAAWLDVPLNLVLDNRPTKLVEMGLVKREVKSGDLSYRCNLKSFVEENFALYEPDLGPDLFHIVLQELKRRILSEREEETNREEAKKEEGEDKYLRLSKTEDAGKLSFLN